MKINKLSFLILIIFILATFGFSQNVDRFGRQSETALEFSTMEKKKDLLEESKKLQITQPENMMMIPVEKAVDPNTYIVGPGDQFGININTIEPINFATFVGPSGDLLIPTVGVLNVNGKTLLEASDEIKEFVISNAYKSADVYVALINVRYFKLQISGAVNNPGFYMVTPLTRMDDILEMAFDFHPFAKEFAIEITKNNGEKQTVDYSNYRLTGNLDNNPYFNEGDKIFIPFGDLETEGVAIRGSISNSGYSIIKPNEKLGDFINRRAGFMETVDLGSISISRGKELINVEPVDLFKTELQAGDIIDIFTEKGVSVNGFVQVPGSYKFFPGYTCADYIGLAGGNSIEGNVKKAIVKHADGTIEKGTTTIIRRGDQIIVPRSLTQWIVGNSSIFQIIATMASVYMSYLAATN